MEAAALGFDQLAALEVHPHRLDRVQDAGEPLLCRGTDLVRSPHTCVDGVVGVIIRPL